MAETLLTPQEPQYIGVLALRDVVVYPNMVIPLFIGREQSVKVLETAMSQNKKILLLTQKEPNNDNPKSSDLYGFGTLATILQLLKLPDGTIKVLIEGNTRARVVNYFSEVPFLIAEIEIIHTAEPPYDNEVEVLTRNVMMQFENYVKINKRVPPEVLTNISGIKEAGRLADTIAAHLPVKLPEKQKVLETIDVKKRLEQLLVLLESELELMQLEKKIQGNVRQQIEKNQREYYLNEQMKAIQKELGGTENWPNEVANYEKRIKKAGMPKEAKEKVLSELHKLKLMSPMAAEATVSRNYLDWMLNLPWKKSSKVSHDLKRAEKILNEDHYGLELVKERILEYLAVQERVTNSKTPILCLVGPPGVGKTSLGQSIARATNRNFARMSLGGVRDEAEIRGHRRTYIGSLPGKIIQRLCKTKVKNPLFLLDEIDKMGQDLRGDPASALLEVLDPEQNNTFNDHYLEVDYDLSPVMFVATSNSLNIPEALLDRMEVIRLAGYTEDEKTHIALGHLIPKQMKNHGLKSTELQITEPVVHDIVRYYTREAGVRNLEREIAKICRKVVKELSESATEKKKQPGIQLTGTNLEKYLGVRRYHYGSISESNRIGQVNGLAWTEVGGDLLTVEAAIVPGKGKIKGTGKLGDVMQESMQAALTVTRSRYHELGLSKDFYEHSDIHIHVPEGATPKDGPSAGIAMCTALASAITRIPVRADVGMTGEITLRGEILAIGGLKEKLLAAHRGGLKIVIIPIDNAKDLKEIPDNIKKDLDIRPVRWIEEVLRIALVEQPIPLVEAEEEIKITEALLKPPKQKPLQKEEHISRRHH